MDESVTLYEVGPRDGLQYEGAILSAEIIASFIDRLSATGLKAIECGSFVSAKAVPQMQHTKEVMQRITAHSECRYICLVPNERGMQAAIDVGVNEIAIFSAASNTFLQHNIGCDIETSYARFEPVMSLAKSQQIKVRGYVSCALGCAYEGAVLPQKVVEVTKKLFELGCFEVSLADTTDMGSKKDVKTLLQVCKDNGLAMERLAVHFHDSEKRRAIEKIIQAIDLGIRTVDAAVNNLGGCPYAPGASGNVATETVIEALEAEGLSTGIDLGLLLEAGKYIQSHLVSE